MFDISSLFASPLWQRYFLGNTLETFATSFMVLLALLVIFAVFQKVVLWRLNYLAKKTKTDIDDTVIKIVRSIKPPFYLFVSLYISFTFLETSDFARMAFGSIVITLIAYQIVKGIHIFVDFLVEKYARSQKDKGAITAIETLGRIFKFSFWFIGVLFVLQNLGVNVTSVVAGLGIGGLAIALAAQNILADLFSSFSIIFDKPFEVGDFIQIGEQMGTVEKVGIKTTRIRALQGEEIIISNQELTSSRIQNYGKLKERRIVFGVGVTYETKKGIIKKVPSILKKIIKAQKDIKFDRAHLKDFGDSSINFEAVYYVKSSIYSKYMDIQESINLGIIDAFEEEKIDMAYPTRTVYLKNS